MKKYFNPFISYLFIIMTIFSSPKISFGAQIKRNENYDYYLTLPTEIKRIILKESSIKNMKELYCDNSLRRVKLVCRDWCNIVKGVDNNFVFANEIIRAAYNLTDDQFKVYQRFLRGILIYRPNERKNSRMIKLRVADLNNPLEGTFNLSKCGNEGEYLTISTGYRKGKRQENENKLEIWLTPRFLVEKEINWSAKHFNTIFPCNWPQAAQIGIMWTWGGWDSLTCYDYLTNQTMDDIANNNLYEKWCACSVGIVDEGDVPSGRGGIVLTINTPHFMFIS